MGQGRKKSQRSYGNHHRKRSITLEVENQDNVEIMHFLGSAAILRNRLENKSIYESRTREPTPFPSSNGNHTQFRNVIPSPSKSREATATSPTNVCLDSDIPFVPTYSLSSNTFEEKTSKNTISSQLVEMLFPDSWILQNNCRREVSEEHRKSICIIFDSLLAMLDCPIPRDAQSILQILFSSKDTNAIRYLVNALRFERIYGLSIHNAIIDKVLCMYPEIQHSLIHVLYETIVDFYEQERESGTASEDSLYVNEAEYGQIHRVVELWTLCVNTLYASYYSLVYNGESVLERIDFPSASDCLLRSGYVLLQLSSVVRKYKSVLVTGFMKLLFMGSKNVHSFLHTITTKLPISSPKKLIAWIEFLSDIVDQCPILLNTEFKKEMDVLLGKIQKMAVGSHIDCCIECLTFLSNKRILIQYFLSDSDRLRNLEKCLHSAQNHWNDTIREKGEDLFDLLLDFMEA